MCGDYSTRGGGSANGGARGGIDEGALDVSRPAKTASGAGIALGHCVWNFDGPGGWGAIVVTSEGDERPRDFWVRENTLAASLSPLERLQRLCDVQREGVANAEDGELLVDILVCDNALGVLGR